MKGKQQDISCVAGLTPGETSKSDFTVSVVIIKGVQSALKKIKQ